MDLLLIVRGLAALSVVAWHAGGYHGGLPLINIPGRVAVWVFFGISGYVISYGFIKNKYKLTPSSVSFFFMNRALRIYPLFLLLSLLGYLTLHLKTGHAPLTLSQLPAQLLALQFNHEYRLNGVFWTLGLEIQFYLLAPILIVPFLVSNARLRGGIIAAAYVVVLIFVGFATKHLGWSYDGRNIFMVLPHFLVGMIACRLVVDMPPGAKGAWVALGGAILLLLTTNLTYHDRPDIFWSIKGILIVDAMICLLVFAHAGLERLIERRPGTLRQILEVLGTVSYGIYAWHAYFMESFDMEGQLLLLSGITISISYLSYRYFESPALRLKRWKKQIGINSA